VRKRMGFSTIRKRRRQFFFAHAIWLKKLRPQGVYIEPSKHNPCRRMYVHI